MKLTPDSTSVRVAAPWSLACPHCQMVLPDWFFEFYKRLEDKIGEPLPEQQEIFRGVKAMDCPNSQCKKGVLFDGDQLHLKKAPPELPVIQRWKHKRDEWAAANPKDAFKLAPFANYPFRVDPKAEESANASNQ